MTEEYCWHCGATVDPDANYCSECGTAVNDSADDDRGWLEEGGTDGYGDETADTHSDYARDDSGTADRYDTHGASSDQYDVHGDSSNRHGTHGDSSNRYDASDDDLLFAAVTHVLAIFTWVVGPTIVLVAADDPFVLENARTALNWQIVYSILMLVSILLSVIVIGVVFLAILPFVNIAFCAIAAVKAYGGETWEYPLTPEFV
ncbi:zinc ribbon domain-containing protein [Natrarchaeobius chitinivorans]|uniref:Zinc ribbon domain-containing protein n=1 Tax=Natrarchaeobius chitinivorans TaxID=1679083 RepID=A0A3N6MHS4_NATCH|nr:zinc ribbon domain-containing protein [Natrarchaeobius chitinivorans]RQG95181.1 zinc ribbon domain-containing protein [Natrarchaeobius chitinivorans]